MTLTSALYCRPHTLHTAGHSRTMSQTLAVQFDYNIPYSKQFVHSKSQQYRRLKTEWRNNVYLRRSNVQVSSVLRHPLTSQWQLICRLSVVMLI